MNTTARYQFKRYAISILTGMAVALLSVLIVSTIAKTSPTTVWRHDNLLVIVITTGAISGFVTFADRALTGVFNGLFLATVGALLSRQPLTHHYYAAYVFGVILGSLLVTYPIKIILVSIILVIGAALAGHVDDVLVFLPSFILSALLLFATRKLAAQIYSPLYTYLTGTVVSSLVAFMSVYVLIILFFSLCYTAAHNWLPTAMFKPTSIERTDMTFGFFTYFSTATITTAGSGEVIPIHPLTRTLVGMETIAGTIWLVVYFAFLMRKLSENN